MFQHFPGNAFGNLKTKNTPQPTTTKSTQEKTHHTPQLRAVPDNTDKTIHLLMSEAPHSK